MRRRSVNPHVVAAAMARADALLSAAQVPFPQPPAPPQFPRNNTPPGPVLVSDAEAAVSEAERLSRDLVGRCRLTLSSPR